jgi:hypothetical protein
LRFTRGSVVCAYLDTSIVTDFNAFNQFSLGNNHTGTFVATNEW